MLRYYMDHHVHAAIVEGLRQRGIDCITAHEDGAAQLDDASLLQRASAAGRILFSQDVDLLVIAAEWMASGREFAGLIYGRQMGLTIGQAIRDLTMIAMVLDAEDMRNRIERIPL